jgi:hypothetical protein
MTDMDKKYDKVLKILRNSKPILTEVDSITEKVMSRLEEEKFKFTFPELIIQYLFGWVYIVWVRRTMVTAALALALFFIYQQSLIIREINDLSGKRIQNSSLLMTKMNDDFADKLMIYKVTGRVPADEKNSVSQKEIDEMIHSLNKLKIKYKDVINLIENDPQLKKYVESRMKEKQK